jgi:predicted small lipoprotein YifL
MEDLNKKILLIVSLFAFAACGVKGRPNPPATPPPLGRGEPMYKETQKKKTTPKPMTISISGEEGLNQ